MNSEERYNERIRRLSIAFKDNRISSGVYMGFLEIALMERNLTEIDESHKKINSSQNLVRLQNAQACLGIARNNLNMEYMEGDVLAPRYDLILSRCTEVFVEYQIKYYEEQK